MITSGFQRSESLLYLSPAAKERKPPAAAPRDSFWLLASADAQNVQLIGGQVVVEKLVSGAYTEP